MGSRTSLGQFWRRENILLLLGFEPQTIQPKASCYTDYAIPASKAFIFRVKLPPTSQLFNILKIYFKNTYLKESGYQTRLGHSGKSAYLSSNTTVWSS